MEVGGAEDKIERAHKAGLELLVLPLPDYKLLHTDTWTVERRKFVAEHVRPAANFVDLLQLTIMGERACVYMYGWVWALCVCCVCVLCVCWLCAFCVCACVCALLWRPEHV